MSFDRLRCGASCRTRQKTIVAGLGLDCEMIARLDFDERGRKYRRHTIRRIQTDQKHEVTRMAKGLRRDIHQEIGDATTALATTQLTDGKSGEIVLLIHGIRTQGEWQVMVRNVLETAPGMQVIPLKYEFLDAVSFLIPFRTRNGPVSLLLRHIRHAQRLAGTAKISVIAHSFGTYAIARILEENPDIILHRLVLCGAIVPRKFRWDRLISQIQTEIINDCGMRDIWPVIAQSATWGYGASGTFGFGSPGIFDRFHNFGHSGFLEEEFVRTFWQPWFQKGTRSAGQVPVARSYWWSVLTVVPIRWIWMLILLILPITVFQLLWRTQQPCEEHVLPDDLRGKWYYNAVTQNSTIVHGGECTLDLRDGRPQFEGKRKYLWTKNTATGTWTYQEAPYSWESDWFVFKDRDHFFFHYTVKVGLEYREGICYGTIKRSEVGTYIIGDILAEINKSPLPGSNTFSRDDLWARNRESTSSAPILKPTP